MYNKIRFGIDAVSAGKLTSSPYYSKRFLLQFALWLWVLYVVWLLVAVYGQLPTLTPEWLSYLSFAQSTEVMDKKGKQLYSFFEENRKYVPYEQINNNTVNAFVAIEDSSFWTNDGVDIMWIARVIFTSVQRAIGLWWRVWWASTITQQLLKNILWLDKDESGLYDKVVRKHKERLLVGKLSSVIESDIHKKYSQLSSDEIQRKKKEKVLELYMNYIFLWNHNYGIQSAAEWYFGKSAVDLSVVESAILASLPQSPSQYNPYKYPSRVLWALKIRDAAGADITGDVLTGVLQQVAMTVMDDATSISKGNGQFQQYTQKAIPDTLTVNGVLYQLSYDFGRKDAVLNRMYEDGYIDQDQLKRAFVDGLTLQLHSPKIEIKAPHFVFWIKELLLTDPRFQDLHLTEEMLNEWGIKITTTLDRDIQQVAEKSITDNMQILHDRWWNNRSLLHVDTTNGDVLAYVGSADYTNTTIQGQNDMVRSARQPGSSIKPLIYVYALQKLPLTLDTPIYDIPLTVGSFTPNNADGKFEWLLPLRFALAHSRNIPAVKAYFAAGKEPELKPFLQSLGLKSLRNNNSYWYSLALWAGEVPMLEMAQAYSFLSKKWEAFGINPILEIRGSDGQILYKKEPQKVTSWLKWWPAYLIRKILSDPGNMPGGWIKYYAISGFKYAVKSWTSNKVITIDGREKSVPRDGWLATYTPSRVTLYRAGNADDKPMNTNALWLLLNSEVNKSFYSQMLSRWFIQNEDMTPVDVGSVSISKVTGKLSNEHTPPEFVVKTYAYNTSLWSDTADSYKELGVDMSCGGKLSPLTPSEQRAKAYVFTPMSIASIDLQDINDWYTENLQKMIASGWSVVYDEGMSSLLLTSEPDKYCPGRELTLSDDITITTSLKKSQSIITKFTLDYTIVSTKSPIQKVVVSANDVVIGTFGYSGMNITDSKPLRLRNKDTEQIIQVVATALDGSAQITTIPIRQVAVDTDKPVLDSVTVVAWEGGYRLKAKFTDSTSGIQSVWIALADGSSQTIAQWEIDIPVATLQTVSYRVQDGANNVLEWTLVMQDYYK